MIYIDCEFDEHNGPLLSLGLAGAVHAYIVTGHKAKQPWVIDNVEPYILEEPPYVPFYETEDVGKVLRKLVPDGATIIADSPVDIYRFCREFNTDNNEWISTDHSCLTFKVLNTEYLSLGIKHHAYWDAYSLWYSSQLNYLGQPYPKSRCRGVFHAFNY